MLTFWSTLELDADVDGNGANAAGFKKVLQAALPAADYTFNFYWGADVSYLPRDHCSVDLFFLVDGSYNTVGTLTFQGQPLPYEYQAAQIPFTLTGSSNTILLQLTCSGLQDPLNLIFDDFSVIKPCASTPGSGGSDPGGDPGGSGNPGDTGNQGGSNGPGSGTQAPTCVTNSISDMGLESGAKKWTGDVGVLTYETQSGTAQPNAPHSNNGVAYM